MPKDSSPSYGVNKKREVLKWHKSNGHVIQRTSKKFGIDVKLISEWLSKEGNNNSDAVPCDPLDEYLLEFFQRESCKGVDVTNKVLINEARKFSKTLGLIDFAVSNQYIKSWRNRMTHNNPCSNQSKKEQNMNGSCSSSDKGSKSLNEIEPVKFNDARILNNSAKCFKWLIHPISPSQFFRNVWEQKPLLIRRAFESYYDGLFSCSEIERILRKESILFNRNIDITKYENGVRETLNADGRAYAPIVWDHYQNGCSVRLLNPQTYSLPLWKLNSTLQEYFNSFVGANVYLTPAGSQGFAPHFDDIEAFILQIEGKKVWKVYAPMAEAELPRYSSVNFTEDQMIEPILEVELVPGDLLYFPRGFIHQAKTTEDVHSLHITLSTYQKNSWADFMEKLIPNVLKAAINSDMEFRRGLPRKYLDYMGLTASDQHKKDSESNKKRDEFKQNVNQLLQKVVDVSASYVDDAADQMGKNFLHDALPPFMTKEDKSRSIYGSGESWSNGKVENSSELDPDTDIRLIKKYAIRILTNEAESAPLQIYHSFENTRVYHELEPQYVEIDNDLAPGVHYLISAYPSYVTIEDLPLDSLEEKMELASLLYEKGLLMTRDILEPFDD